MFEIVEVEDDFFKPKKKLHIPNSLQQRYFSHFACIIMLPGLKDRNHEERFWEKIFKLSCVKQTKIGSKKEQERLKPAKQTLALVEERRETLRELEERKALELRNIIQAKK